MPEVCGRRLAVEEMKAALLGNRDAVAVQAVIQLLTMQRLNCMDAASKEAWHGKPSTYQLGGVQALEDLLAEILNLTETGRISDDVRAFFAD